MDAVLGLSMTSSSIGWVLLEGPGADANTLDHDVFDLGAGTADDGDISTQMAAVRGAQTIATASGHQVKSIGVTWTDDADSKAMLLLKSLEDLDFDNIVRVRLPDATRTWARAFGDSLGFDKCAVCVVDSAAVTALSFGYDSVRTVATHMRESADGLIRWLTEVFEHNRLEPDSLFLVGSRGDLELISGCLEETLSIPVDASENAQLALARGAALALSPKGAAAVDEQVSIGPVDDKPTHRWPRLRQRAPALTQPDVLETWTEAIKGPRHKKPVDHVPTQPPALVQHTPAPTTQTDVVESKTEAVETTADGAESKTEAVETNADVVESKTQAVETNADVAESKTQAVETNADVVELKTEVIDRPVGEKRVVELVFDPPSGDEAAKRTWRYGSHARAGTALVAGVVALFVIVSTVSGLRESRSAENRPASNASATSDSPTTSIRVRAVPSAAAVPPPPPAAVHQVAAEPASAPEPPAVLPPSVQVAAPETDVADEPVAPRAPTRAEPMAAPQTSAPQPAAAPQAPIAPLPAEAPQAPIAPLPAEAPQPHLASPPAAAPPAPEAPPPPPPDDSIAVVLSPLLGALP